MFQLIKIQLEIFAPLQALFPTLKIDIFCRIVPLSFIEELIKIELETFGPLQTLLPPLKIDIFCCIVPLFFIKNMKSAHLRKAPKKCV